MGNMPIRTEIPLSDEAVRILRAHSYQSHILETQVFPLAQGESVYDIMYRIANQMELAGIDKRFIYAYVKTGRMLTEENKKFVSLKDRREWEKAILQYERLIQTSALKRSDSLLPFVKASKEIQNPKLSEKELEFLFDSRFFNRSIIESSRSQFINNNLPDAVFSAYKKVLHNVQEKSDLLDEDGVNLVTKAFNPKSPLLISHLALWSQDQSIQEGIMHLFMGAVLCIRNVFAHKETFLVKPEQTLEYLSFASFLSNILEATLHSPKQ